MWLQAGLIGLLYVSFFQLYFLFTDNRLMVWVMFVVVAGITATRLLFHAGEMAVRRWVMVVFFVSLFLSVFMYVSVIEIEWLRQIGAIGFSLFASSFVLLLSSGRGDIRSVPRTFVVAITLLSVLLFLFSSSFFHSLKLFFVVRSVTIPLLVAIIHTLITYLLFLSLRLQSRVIVPTLLTVFVVSFQSFWVLEFLPFGPMSLGLLQTIPLMFLLLVERDRLLDELRYIAYIRWSFIALAMIILVMFFSRWS